VGNVDASSSTAAVAEAATARAIARLLRGATWQALTWEIAWHAVAAADGDRELARSLVGVADEVLSERIDGIECRADAAALRAWRDHVAWRPHDHEGADLAAAIAASDEAEGLVVAAYEEARDRVEEAALTRLQRGIAQRGRPRRFRRRSRPARTPMPRVDLGDLGRPRAEYGWPRRDVA
jgi:hypothetical protein